MVYCGLIIHKSEVLMSNYENAKRQADELDEKIIDLISQNNHVKVEAGAGAGKTYSLHKVIDLHVLDFDDDAIREGVKNELQQK